MVSERPGNTYVTPSRRCSERSRKRRESSSEAELHKNHNDENGFFSENGRSGPNPSKSFNTPVEGIHMAGRRIPGLGSRNQSWTFDGTPLPACANSDSDLDPSIYDISAFDFPEPPPIGSPTIRRMRSSPWFLLESESDRNTAVHQWRSSIPADLNFNPGESLERTGLRSSVPVVCRKDLGYSTPFDERNLELEPFNKEFLAFESKGLGFSDIPSGSSAENISSASELTEQPYARPIRFETRGDLNGTTRIVECGNERMAAKHVVRAHPLDSLPRIIRKVASMRSDHPKGNQENHNILTSHNRIIHKSRSFRSILRLSDKQQTLQDNVGMEEQDTWASKVLSNKDQVLARASLNVGGSGEPLDNAGHRKVKQWPSSPNHGPSSQDKNQGSPRCPDGPSVPEVLEAPFLHLSQPRKFAKHSVPSSQERPKAAKSFINITPKRELKDKVSAKKERVKSMVSRASNNLFHWGKWRKKGVPS